ncbi:MAG: chloride channel protein [Bacteroides sp.]|nr:chloride channel protein [Bacteroides sp.]
MSRHIINKFVEWRAAHLSEKAFVFILGGVVGVLSGVGAFILKRLVAFISRHLTSGLHVGSGNWILLLLPLLGIVLTGIFCRYIVRAKLSNGTEQMIRDLKNKIYRLKSYLTFTPILASSLTLGFGGSAGSEGPIAYTGAAIGSNLARFFKMSPSMLRLMIGCGAGAGIAGIFKSPMGGALFTLEVLRMPMSTTSVILLLETVVIASMTAFALSGFTLDIPFDGGSGYGLDILPYIVLLGVFCGFYSLYYSFIMKKIGRLLHGIANKWLRNVVAGGFLASMVFLFPVLYGEGYATVGRIINGNFTTILNDSIFAGDSGSMLAVTLIVGAVAMVKCFVTSATNYGGGVSGDFAPTLFAGCMVGFFFASLTNILLGLHLPVAHFAFYAMAGVMAGAIRAPLMAMFLTCEMGGAYAYFFPLMLTAAISFGIVRLFTADSFFNRHLDRNNGLLSQIKHQ